MDKYSLTQNACSLIQNVHSLITSCAKQLISLNLTNAPDTSLTSYNNSRGIASNGNVVHVVWSDKRDGNWEIYYKRSTDGGINWGTDMRLTNNTSSSIKPFMSISNSVLNVVWSDDRDGNMEIYYKRNPTGNPTGIVPISTIIPKEFKLMQNYPNPFNPVTKINFDVPVCHSGEGRNPVVTLVIYDMLGRVVETLVNEVQSAGSYSVEFNAANLSGGVYFCRMQSAEFTDVKKLVLLK